MRFGILGPVEIWGGVPSIVAMGRRQQALLAVLLVHANRLVSADQLVDWLWEQKPPRTAQASVHNAVSDLRRSLGVGGPGDGTALLTRPAGYLLVVPPGEIDADRFEELAGAAELRMADGSVSGASALFSEALGLWRGPALAGVEVEVCRAAAIRLEERRLAVQENRLEVELRLGRHVGAAAELQALVAEHPLRERLWALLMLALHSANRRADALAAYHRLRGILVDLLAIEPGLAVQGVQGAILSGADPWTAYRSSNAATSAMAEPLRITSAEPAAVVGEVPRELPPPVYAFTGRADQLSTLDSMLAGTGAEPAGPPATQPASRTMVTTVIAGAAGVGKTALAVHWAHRVAEAFGDGQLYVDLRGYDSDRPVHPAEVLAGFLRTLGVDGRAIPATLAERAARYRSLMSGRRMLVVLDNANTADQVRPLLPGGGSCQVLVTSRDSLTGLIARDGARRIELELLTVAEATTLLHALVGERVHAEPEAAAALIDQCARLPLALRIAAELAAARRPHPLAELVDELADQRHRLDLLQPADDERTAVRTVFCWSYRQLPVAEARLFRRLGLHPGADHDAHAATALAGTDVAVARLELAGLVRAHLATENPPGRYRMHDLLRVYAVERAHEDEVEPDRRAALTRLLDHYLATAAAAMNLLHPAESYLRPETSDVAHAAVELTTESEARAWLTAERANLVAAIRLAAQDGWSEHACKLSATIRRFLDLGSHHEDSLVVHGYGLQAARALDDHAAQASSQLSLGVACYCMGRYDDAADHYRQAIEQSRAAGDPRGEARALGNIGMLYAKWGNYDQAIDHYRQVVSVARAIGDRQLEATHLGWIGTELGRTGRYDEALAHLHQALSAHRELGYPMRIVETLMDVGQVQLWAGQPAEALQTVREAVAGARELNDRVQELLGRIILAEIHCASGQFDQALIHHQAVLDADPEIAFPELHARALDGMAHVLVATGRPGQARECWRDAAELYASLGMPEADQIHEHLATVSGADPPAG